MAKSLGMSCRWSALLTAGAAMLSGCPDMESASSTSGASSTSTASSGSSTTSSSTSTSTSTSSGAEDGGDDGATVARKATLAFAAPDLPPQYACFVGFKPGADGSPTGDPVVARGPWGVPDPADPNAPPVFGNGALGLQVKLASGFPYGAVVSLPIRKRDAPFFDQLAGVLFTVSQIDPPVYAGNGVDSSACKSAWAAASSSPGPKFVTKPGTIQIGHAYLAGISGCATSSTDPQCAGGNNLTTTVLPIDLGTPTSFAGDGDTTVGIQVADLSPFAGYQDVDLYLQPMRPGADAGAAEPDGAPIAIGAHDKGLAWQGITAASTGIRLSSATRDLALFLVVKHGEAPFCGGAPGCATTIAIPIKPFLDKYAPLTGAGWSANQTFVLFGRPPLTPDEKAADFLRLGIFASGF